MAQQAPPQGTPSIGRGAERADVVYRCHFCGSGDTMTPFHRRARVFLLSALLPSLEWRYCRSCVRHFLVFRRSGRS